MITWEGGWGENKTQSARLFCRGVPLCAPVKNNVRPILRAHTGVRPYKLMMVWEWGENVTHHGTFRPPTPSLGSAACQSKNLGGYRAHTGVRPYKLRWLYTVWPYYGLYSVKCPADSYFLLRPGSLVPRPCRGGAGVGSVIKGSR